MYLRGGSPTINKKVVIWEKLKSVTPQFLLFYSDFVSHVLLTPPSLFVCVCLIIFSNIILKVLANAKT